MFNKILCSVDGSDHASKALDIAIDLAKKYDAPLVLLHALLRNIDAAGLQRFAEIEGLVRHVEPEIRRLESAGGRLALNLGPSYEDVSVSARALVEIGQHVLEDAKADAEHQGVRNVSTLVVDGDPADQILRCIKEQNIDCVVMGSRGLGDIRGAFLGSVSHKVANRAPCTCIAVK